jgi:hypothetical protein
MLRCVALWGVAAMVLLGCRGGNAQPDGLAGLIERCRVDAAQRAGVEVETVALLKAESVVWSDGSLGCPQPGMDYFQALVPGYRLTLGVGGKEYDYHTDRTKRFVFCEDGGREPAQLVGPVELPTVVTEPLRARPGVLYLEPTPGEPNGNCRLQLLGTRGEEAVTVRERCTGFAVSARGWLLAKERTSRSTHDLSLGRVRGEARVIAQAFDFESLSFSLTDDRYAVLVRGQAGQPWVVHLGRVEGGGPEALEWAPTVRRGDRARVSLAGDVLLITEADSDDDPPKTTVLDLGAQGVLAEFRSPQAALAGSGAETED